MLHSINLSLIPLSIFSQLFNPSNKPLKWLTRKKAIYKQAGTCICCEANKDYISASGDYLKITVRLSLEFPVIT